MTKHYGGITKAAKAAAAAHFEFGSTMADYAGLRARYKRFRVLEDVDDTKAPRGDEYRPPVRVRFLNYYTASTGRPKARPRSRSPGKIENMDGLDENDLDARLRAVNFSEASLESSTGSRSLRISNEPDEGRPPSYHDVDSAHDADGTATASTSTGLKASSKPHDSSSATFDDAATSPDLRSVSPNPEPEAPDAEDAATPTAASTDGSPTAEQSPLARQATLESTLNIPPVPSIPPEPPAFDPSPYEDPDVRKFAQDMHTRTMRAHLQVVKDRDKAAAERVKLIEKKEKQKQKGIDATAKQKQKEMDATAKQARKARERREKEEAKREQEEANRAKEIVAAEQAAALARENAEPTAAASLTSPDPGVDAARGGAAGAKPPREKKFCLTPPKAADGSRDPTWERVYMPGMDEVGAHLGLFFEERPHYEELVNRVGDKIKEWVERDRRVRMKKEGR